MNKKEYADRIEISGLSELDKTKQLAFYEYKMTGKVSYSSKDLEDLMSDFGQNKPNSSRLKRNMLNTEYFKRDENYPNQIRFTDIGLDILNEEQKDYWENYSEIESNSELIDENKFCGYRGYLNSLIRQINHCYANHCYDASAVLMRRLFEILLILSYQANGIDEEIKTSDGNGYKMLEKIVANAKTNKTLNISRIKSRYDDFRNIGNSSAHNITYIASKKDIDDIKHDYRIALEELYNKAKMM